MLHDAAKRMSRALLDGARTCSQAHAMPAHIPPRCPDEPQHRRLEEAGAGCHRLSQHQQAQDDACWEAPAVALIPRAAFVLFVTTPDSAAFKSSAPLWMLS